jgi:hypothetical protein
MAMHDRHHWRYPLAYFLSDKTGQYHVNSVSRTSNSTSSAYNGAFDASRGRSRNAAEIAYCQGMATESSISRTSSRKGDV